MGIGERLRRLIDPAKEPNPDDWVVVSTVRFHDGPMLASALEAAGVRVVLQEVRPAAAHLDTWTRLVVQQRDAARAEDTLRELREA